MVSQLKVGDAIPEVTLKRMGDIGPVDITTSQIFKEGKTVLFTVPGAFTPTCSARHLPGFLENFASFKAKGVGRLVCLSVNDAFVMDAWGKQQQVGEQILMVADGNGDFATATGLVMDARGFGMGQRIQRTAMVIENNYVRILNIEAPKEFSVSAAEHVLKQL